MSYFFQHPYELDNDSRVQKLKRKMWCEGMGIFWEIFMLLRRGRGIYPLNAIVSEVGGEREARQRKVKRVLLDFDLFVISNNMVELSDGLSVSDLLQKDRKRASPRDKLKTLRERMTTDSAEQELFPEESHQMYEEAYLKTQQEIREHNTMELSKAIDL